MNLFRCKESEPLHQTLGSHDVPRVGRIWMQDGKLVGIRRRVIHMAPSAMRVWWDSHYHFASQDRCYLDYRCTRHQPGFITLQYVRSYPGTTLASFRGAVRCLDAVAQCKQAQAIFAHVCTTAISDRLLLRWGWERHAGRLTGRHWIKRFYDGYPQLNLTRYH